VLINSTLQSALKSYLELHPIGRIKVEVIGIGSFSDRSNEYERATSVALHYALADAGMPTPMLFST
jgi:hypothetical protein